jgi:hypothetical protein
MKDERAMLQFLDSVDRRQLTMSQLNDLDPGASLDDVIEKLNAILATHRTR